MNEAYFVGKNQLLEWINTLVNVKVEKVEQMCTGAVYCQLFEMLHPGSIPIKKIDFNGKYEYEYINNWKLLQTAFQKLAIEKPIPVERLIKGRYQDNLEFFQWMYKYAQGINHSSAAVDSVNQMKYNNITGDTKFKIKNGKDMLNKFNTTVAPAKPTGRPLNTTNEMMRMYPIDVNSNKNTNATITNGIQSFNREPALQLNVANIMNNNEIAYIQELENLKRENQLLRDKYQQIQIEQQELNKVAQEIEKERDFYFQKVCDVEKMCKSYNDQRLPLLDKLYNSLYQTYEEAATAVAVPSNGNEQFHMKSDNSQCNAFGYKDNVITM